jgi:hypothetical protein
MAIEEIARGSQPERKKSYQAMKGVKTKAAAIVKAYRRREISAKAAGVSSASADVSA